MNIYESIIAGSDNRGRVEASYTSIGQTFIGYSSVYLLNKMNITGILGHTLWKLDKTSRAYCMFQDIADPDLEEWIVKQTDWAGQRQVQTRVSDLVSGQI